MKIYDLSQPLNEQVSFWPYYPPFEVKYIKRKAEHGVNAQYIQTSNHMGTHLDAPRHFVTNGMTIDEIPVEWLCGPGVIVNLSDEMDELAIYTPKMIEDRVEVKKGDLLFLHTGWEKHAQFGSEPDEEKYIHRHPGAHPDMVPWLLEKEIHIWGVDCISTDHPMNLPIGRFLGKGMHGHCDRVRKQCEDKFGGPEGVAQAVSRLGVPADAQRALPEELHAHREPRRRHHRAGAAEQAADPRLLPVEVQGRRGGVLPRGGVHGRLETVTEHGDDGYTDDGTTDELRDIADRSATELRRLIATREVSVREVVAASSRTRRATAIRTLNAVVTLNPRAMDDARALDARLAKGEDPGLLCGLPVGIKDVTPVAGLRTTFGSPIYADHVPRRRRAGRPAAARGGRGHSRQDELSRSSRPAATPSMKCSAARAIRGIRRRARADRPAAARPRWRAG